ncbi:6-bladed beta-propeller [Bacteroides sp. OttesenSCG-928-D19]|nr:6-bladed beta-propeller [Bacteroides sp. OttesenSCG-928-D19]
MKKTIFLLILLYSLLGCSPKGGGSVSEVSVDKFKMCVFPLNKLKPEIEIISLSSLVEYCDFVKLESSEEAFINPWMTTVTEKYIGVMQENASYKLFERSGKFLCNVGTVGQGPGEYNMLYDDFIDDKNDLIYLIPFIGNKILIYNTSGKLKKEIVSPQNLVSPRIFLSDEILTVIQMPFTGENAIAIQFDVISGQVINKLTPPSHLVAQNNQEAVYNSRNIPGVFDIIYTCSDTLYHFDLINNEMVPVFTMEHESLKDLYPRYSQLNKNLIITDLYERGIVATDLKNKTSSWIKVVNDYYGKFGIDIFLFSFRNGYFVHNIQPEQLIDDIKQCLTDNNRTEQEKQKLLETLSELKKGTNNVVFLGKLKSII